MDKAGLIVIGATGIVGQEILSTMADEPYEPGDLQISASEDSEGEVYDFRGKEVEVVSVEKLTFDKKSLVVLCTPVDVSQMLLKDLHGKARALIDCSGVVRINHQLELMPEALASQSFGQSYALRSAAGFMIKSFLDALDITAPVESLCATVIEPVSGAGRMGVDELWNQTKGIFNQSGTDPEFFPEQIAFNVLSQVDVLREDGSTAYEARVISELSKFISDSSLVSVTALRAPILYGTGVSLSFCSDRFFEPEEILSSLEKSPRFAIDRNSERSPSTISVVSDDRIHMGRLRVRPLSKSKGCAVSCWLVADNIKACIARPVVDLYRSLMPST